MYLILIKHHLNQPCPNLLNSKHTDRWMHKGFIYSPFNSISAIFAPILSVVNQLSGETLSAVHCIFSFILNQLPRFCFQHASIKLKIYLYYYINQCKKQLTEINQQKQVWRYRFERCMHRLYIPQTSNINCHQISACILNDFTHEKKECHM